MPPAGKRNDGNPEEELCRKITTYYLQLQASLWRSQHQVLQLTVPRISLESTRGSSRSFGDLCFARTHECDP